MVSLGLGLGWLGQYVPRSSVDAVLSGKYAAECGAVAVKLGGWLWVPVSTAAKDFCATAFPEPRAGPYERKATSGVMRSGAASGGFNAKSGGSSSRRWLEGPAVGVRWLMCPDWLLAAAGLCTVG